MEHFRQADEQDWTQNDAAVEQVRAPATFPGSRLEQGSTSYAFHPSSSILTEPENAVLSMPRDALGHAEEGGLEGFSEGNEQYDTVSVTSFANSAASGLGHLLRAQQPWSESSSSPDRTSTTGSAEVRDISQLEAEVVSQPGHQLPQELLLPGTDAGLGSQLPLQLLLSHGQEQPMHAQPVLIGGRAQLVADDEQEQHQHEREGGNQAESHDEAWNLPVDAVAEAGIPLVGHATGKQITNSVKAVNDFVMPVTHCVLVQQHCIQHSLPGISACNLLEGTSSRTALLLDATCCKFNEQCFMPCVMGQDHLF